MVVKVEGQHPQFGTRLDRSWRRPSEMANLIAVALETHMGSLVPDVLAEREDARAPSGVSPLLIEITVTNKIGEERLQRIRQANLPTLEIDLSGLTGRITREQLTEVVIERVAGKRWLHDPCIEVERCRLQAELNDEAEAIKRQRDAAAAAEAEQRQPERPYSPYGGEGRPIGWMPARRTSRGTLYLTPEQHQAAMSLTLPAAAEKYLQAVAQHANARLEAEKKAWGDKGRSPTVAKALQGALVAAEGVVIHGFPEARDEALFGEPGSLLERLLMIRDDGPVGMRGGGALAAAKALHDEEPVLGRPRWHTLYLIALKVYRPGLIESVGWLHGWRRMIVDSVTRGEILYFREPTYDRLLAVLFPEMAQALQSSFARWPIDISAAQRGR